MGIWYVRMQGGTLQTLAIIGQTSSFANTRHLLLLQIFQIFDIIAFGFHNILTIRDIYFLKKIGKYFGIIYCQTGYHPATVLCWHIWGLIPEPWNVPWAEQCSFQIIPKEQFQDVTSSSEYMMHCIPIYVLEQSKQMDLTWHDGIWM